ncbi:MAG TPA: outer membrane beta-barrel protein [Rariglobus sp.]
MHTRILSILTLAVSLFATTALKASDSDTSAYFKKGDILLEFSGSFTHATANGDGESASVNFVYADIGASYFLTDHISTGADTFWLYVPESGDVDGSALAVGLEWNVRYHFNVSRYFYPYVGVHAGYAFGRIEGDDDSESDHLTTLGAHAGFVIPVNDNVFFDVQLKYTDYDIPVADFDLGTTQLLLGLKIKL